MSDNEKVQPSHLQRWAYVYVRQSTAAQVANNRESTDRQYKLRERALRLGWPEQRVKILDQDLAQSGTDTAQRDLESPPILVVRVQPPIAVLETLQNRRPFHVRRKGLHACIVHIAGVP